MVLQIDYDFALEHEGKEDAFLSTWHIKYFSQIMALGRRHEEGALTHIIDEFGENGDRKCKDIFLHCISKSKMAFGNLYLKVRRCVYIGIVL